jgi:hypothetical protein
VPRRTLGTGLQASASSGPGRRELRRFRADEACARNQGARLPRSCCAAVHYGQRAPCEGEDRSRRARTRSHEAVGRTTEAQSVICQARRQDESASAARAERRSTGQAPAGACRCRSRARRGTRLVATITTRRERMSNMAPDYRRLGRRCARRQIGRNAVTAVTCSLRLQLLPFRPADPMKLYYFPGAHSIAPHIVAREAGSPRPREVDPAPSALPPARTTSR